MTNFFKFTSLSLIVFFNFSFSQKSILQVGSKFAKSKEEAGWTSINKFGLDLNQVSFVNWNAGGTNSISGRSTFLGETNYRTQKKIWNTRLNIRYGLNKQDGQSIRKTDDVLDLNSTFGYQFRRNSNWYYSANLNLKTQLTNGFNYKEDEKTPISKFMAPGYLLLGVGAVYGKNIENLSIYLSPITLKSTFVLDEQLANAGSFGVRPAVKDENENVIEPGAQSRHEFGMLVTNQYTTNLMENISINNRLQMYSDYINKFGNIDIDWELIFNFKVNDFVKASLASNLLFDDDVKVVYQDPNDSSKTIEGEAKVQWKQLLGIGVVFDL